MRCAVDLVDDAGELIQVLRTSRRAICAENLGMLGYCVDVSLLLRRQARNL